MLSKITALLPVCNDVEVVLHTSDVQKNVWKDWRMGGHWGYFITYISPLSNCSVIWRIHIRYQIWIIELKPTLNQVLYITPSAASTNMTAPSLILNAAVTSSEKFTWPEIIEYNKTQGISHQKKNICQVWWTVIQWFYINICQERSPNE